MTSPRATATVLACLLLLPAAARGNGFALDIQGVWSNGTASAAAGLARDPSSMFVNPATLAKLDGTRLTAGAMLIAPSARFVDDGSTLLVGAPNQGNDGDGGQAGVAPWIFASSRLTPELTVGVELYAPFGLATDYGRGSYFVGRYQGIESRIEALAMGPAVAWKVSDLLSLGAAVAARRDQVVQSLALDVGSLCYAGSDAGTCDALGLVPGQSDGYGRFSGTGWGWTTNVGLTLDPAPGTTLGLSWRHESAATVKGEETIELPENGALVLPFTASHATMDYALPDFVTLHGAQRLGEAFTVMAALQWSRWSAFDQVTLRPDEPTGLPITSKQGFKDAWRLSVGGAWVVSPALELFAGVSREQTPVQAAYRQATLPEADTWLAGLGLQAELGKGFSLSAAYQRVMSGTGHVDQDQTATGGDHLIGSAQGRANLAIAQLNARF